MMAWMKNKKSNGVSEVRSSFQIFCKTTLKIQRSRHFLSLGWRVLFKLNLESSFERKAGSVPRFIVYARRSKKAALGQGLYKSHTCRADIIVTRNVNFSIRNPMSKTAMGSKGGLVSAPRTSWRFQGGIERPGRFDFTKHFLAPSLVL